MYLFFNTILYGIFNGFNLNPTEKISNSVFSPDYWEESYQSGEMGWDLGRTTPVFENWIQSKSDPLSICILGAGNGWDALHFSKLGHTVTAVDFAESAINNMHKSAQRYDLSINVLHLDIFDLSQKFHQDFDVVLEYTCFCAIDPMRRKDYIEMVSHILKPEGELVGLFFPIDKDPTDGGPPFGVDIHATTLLFSRYMRLIKKETSQLSIERRKGREVFVIFRKDGN